MANDDEPSALFVLLALAITLYMAVWLAEPGPQAPPSPPAATAAAAGQTSTPVGRRSGPASHMAHEQPGLRGSRRAWLTGHIYGAAAHA